MTLCELATAKYYSIPMECNSFTISQSSFNVTIDSGLSSECVSALSRSAQFWSSYSGYLREIPQLCFAFQRWNDIGTLPYRDDAPSVTDGQKDVARNIYHNITLEKLALVRLMQERELEEKFSAERWSLGMVELINTVAFIQNISQQLDVRLDIQTREVGRSLSNVATTMEKRAGTILDNSIRNLSHIVSASLISDLGLIAISQLNFSIGSTMSSFDEAIHLRLEKAFSSLLERQQESAKIAITFENQWRTTQGEFWALQESISEMSRLISRSALESFNSRNQALELRQAQQEIAQSVFELVNVVDQVTNRTRTHLYDLNETAAVLKENLLDASGTLRASRWWTDWWTDGLMLISSFVLRSSHHLTVSELYNCESALCDQLPDSAEHLLYINDLVSVFSVCEEVFSVSVILVERRKPYPDSSFTCNSSNSTVRGEDVSHT
ncbi:hypothetical protein AAF712_003217 [Marasmius tenuissimus]|uniref:Uncharacterized protein n=1 Tax=Marasmius tenuissimus TaxID=585030 RepID=A0ABR3A858_9AGAR